ncbi:hypothetical protein PCL_08653 [Purpureocillium lilacinum]|uniref:Uncharacterized protein n=1 Tax=Purpureocillium lilacinum TaxID=33203 RepID=A0A2U3DR49_PURLI|nr:hypothetical protein PCL_08653 [Purpureocillium lilacinum]
MGGSLNPSVQTTSIRGLTFVDMLDLEAQNKREPDAINANRRIQIMMAHRSVHTAGDHDGRQPQAEQSTAPWLYTMPRVAVLATAAARTTMRLATCVLTDWLLFLYSTT